MKNKLVLEIVRGSISYTVGIDQLRGIIGRGPDADIRVPFSTISSAHIEFKSENQGFFFRDLESTNGTFVEGEKIEPNQWFEISDEISLKIVDTQLIFRTTTTHTPHFTMIQSGTLARKLLMDVLASTQDENEEDAFLEALCGPDKGRRLSLHDQIEQVEIGGSAGIFSFPTGTPALMATIVRDGDGFSILPKERVFVDGAPMHTEFRLCDGKEIELGKIRFIFCDPLEAYFDELDHELNSPESSLPPLDAQPDPQLEKTGPEDEQSQSEPQVPSLPLAKKSKKKRDWLLIFVVLLVLMIAIAAIFVVLSL